MKSLKYVIPGLAFFVLAGFFYKGLFLDPRTVPSPLIGQPAPLFELEELRDPAQSFVTADMHGQPAIMNVWATWCAGCREEHEFLMRLGRSGTVPIYGLNYRDERPAALQWLSRLGDPYVKIAYDPDGMGSLDWGVYGAPETFLLDPDGTVVYKHLGPMTPRVWEQEFLPRISAMRVASR